MGKLNNVIRYFDSFGEPFSVNLKGQTKHKTLIGAIFTFLAFTATLVYGYSKCLQLINGDEPSKNYSLIYHDMDSIG